MKIYSILTFFCLFSFLFSQETFKNFNMHSIPTKWEFMVYKETWSLLWNAPPGEKAEREVVSFIANKYSTSAEHINNILLKLQYYNNVQNSFPGKLVEDMTWTEFEKLVKKFGAPWPNEKKEHLDKNTQN